MSNNKPRKKSNRRVMRRPPVVLSKNFQMHRLRVDPHPNEFTIRPWFPITLRINGAGTSITLGNIAQALSSQVGIDPASNYYFRFQQARFWGGLRSMNATTALDPIVISVVDLFSGIGASSSSEDVLNVYSDYPDQVSRARIGFAYSFAQQQVSVLATALSTTVVYRMTGMGANSIVLLHVLWRAGLQAVPPALLGEESDFVTLP